MAIMVGIKFDEFARVWQFCPKYLHDITVIERCRMMAKKDIEVQPGFECGSSEFRSDRFFGTRVSQA